MGIPAPLSSPMPAALSLLQQRHSAPSRQLGEPAPDEATLRALLEAAIRVPDHGKLVPFRLIRLQGDAKLRFGEQLSAIAIRNNPDLSESKQEKERLRYTFAPLVIVVVACKPTARFPRSSRSSALATWPTIFCWVPTRWALARNG